jgi:hypothetical protein
MTCHAAVCLAAAICLLPVAVIQAALDALLVAAIGTAPLLESDLAATSGTAVALSAITVPANAEHRLAAAAAADPLVENGCVNRHARRTAGLDNGCESWQVRTSSSVVTCSAGCPAGAPPLTTAGLHPPSLTTVHPLGSGLGGSAKSLRHRLVGTDANLRCNQRAKGCWVRKFQRKKNNVFSKLTAVGQGLTCGEGATNCQR